MLITHVLLKYWRGLLWCVFLETEAELSNSNSPAGHPPSCSYSCDYSELSQHCNLTESAQASQRKSRKEKRKEKRLVIQVNIGPS